MGDTSQTSLLLLKSDRALGCTKVETVIPLITVIIRKLKFQSKTINFYTVILRKNQEYWVCLCLENGLVGQGNTQQQAIDKLREAIASFTEIHHSENNVYF